jgi:hypothetical protein
MSSVAIEPKALGPRFAPAADRVAAIRFKLVAESIADLWSASSECVSPARMGGKSPIASNTLAKGRSPSPWVGLGKGQTRPFGGDQDKTFPQLWNAKPNGRTPTV